MEARSCRVAIMSGTVADVALLRRRQTCRWLAEQPHRGGVRCPCHLQGMRAMSGRTAESTARRVRVAEKQEVVYRLRRRRIGETRRELLDR